MAAWWVYTAATSALIRTLASFLPGLLGIITVAVVEIASVDLCVVAIATTAATTVIIIGNIRVHGPWQWRH